MFGFQVQEKLVRERLRRERERAIFLGGGQGEYEDWRLSKLCVGGHVGYLAKFSSLSSWAHG